MCTTIVLGTRSRETRPITNAFGRFPTFANIPIRSSERLLTMRAAVQNRDFGKTDDERLESTKADGHLLESRTTEEFVSGKRVRPVTIRLAAL
jgi:hypothetical protein